MELLRRLNVDIDFLPAAPAANLVPDVLFCIPLDQQPQKTADIWRRYHWSPSQMTSKKRAQKLHTDDTSLPMPELGWSYSVGNLIQPIRSTTQIWVVTRHQNGISALVSETSFSGETSGKPSGSVANCRRFLRLLDHTGGFWSLGSPESPYTLSSPAPRRGYFGAVVQLQKWTLQSQSMLSYVEN